MSSPVVPLNGTTHQRGQKRTRNNPNDPHATFFEDPREAEEAEGRTEEDQELEDLEISYRMNEELQQTTEMLAKLATSDRVETAEVDHHAVGAAAMVASSIKAKTTKGYQGHVNGYTAYWKKHDAQFDVKARKTDTPTNFNTYVFSECGPIDKGGKGKGYSTAVAIRASLTWFYSEMFPNDTHVAYIVNDDGVTCRGIPTRSREVHKFMIGLEKYKAQNGEVSESAKAATLPLMKQLFDLNVANVARNDAKEGALKWLIYLYAYLLMLRMEEVLRITCEDIELVPNYLNHHIDITMGVRKHVQTGEKHRYRCATVPKEVPEYHWLCPVRALQNWTVACGGKLDSGPLFRKVKNGNVLHTEVVTTANLQNYLQRDLQKLGLSDWALYGTHSFRRGGCQYRSKYCGWTPGEVAKWGGWALTEATTIMKYYFSPKDDHSALLDLDNWRNRRHLKLEYDTVAENAQYIF